MTVTATPSRDITRTSDGEDALTGASATTDTRGGVTYECLVAHGAEYAGTWGPPQGSVWVVVT